MSEDLAWGAAEALSSAVDRFLAADRSGVDDSRPLAEVVGEVVGEVARKIAVAQQLLVSDLIAQGAAGERGTTLANLPQKALRLSPGEAKTRIERAEALSPRRALTGDVLPPRLPETAAAQAEGAISVDHVRVIQHHEGATSRGGSRHGTEAEADLAQRGRGHPHRLQRRERSRGHRPLSTPRLPPTARRPHRPTPRLRRTRLRRPASLDSGSSHHPLELRRKDRPGQSDPALR